MSGDEPHIRHDAQRSRRERKPEFHPAPRRPRLSSVDDEKTPVRASQELPTLVRVERPEPPQGKWHVHLELEPGEVTQLLELGLASNASLIWRSGLPKWLRLGEVPELSEVRTKPNTKPPVPPRRKLPSAPQTVHDEVAVLREIQRSRLAPWAALMSHSGQVITPKRPVPHPPTPVVVMSRTRLPSGAGLWDDAPVLPVYDRRALARSGRWKWGGAGWVAAGVVAAAAVLVAAAGLIGRSDPAPELRAAHVQLPIPEPARTGTPAVQPAASGVVMAVSALPSLAPPTAPPPSAADARSVVESSRGSGRPFDKRAAARALGGAVGRAAHCVEPGSSVTASVHLTFAPSGTAQNVSLGSTLPNARAERCVMKALRRARVPAFSGEPVTVKKTIRLKR